MILTTISSNSAFHRDVRAALDGLPFEAAWDLSYDQAARLHGLKADQKCLGIIDFSDQASALAFSRALIARPQIATIGLGCGESREELLVLMQAGVRDVLPQFTRRDLRFAVNRALAALGSVGEILADLYAFVPAKPGSGATTVATHASAMAATLTEDPALLLDFDIRLGVTNFLLKAHGNHTILDALHRAKDLDREVWSNLVSQIGNLHMLGSGAADFANPFEADRFTALLDFAVRQYALVAVDLPGSMEDYECSVLLRATRILLVCTPDIDALHLARRKAQWFRDMQIADKVSVVLNCVERRNTLSVEDIERIIQLPVRYQLPAGAKDISKAVQKGGILDPTCNLGRQIAAIAADMTPGKSVSQKPSSVRRFVEYFSVSSARGA